MKGESNMSQTCRVAFDEVNFRLSWAVLTEQGECDALESAEFHRIHGEWFDAGRPLQASRFILERANRPVR